MESMSADATSVYQYFDTDGLLIYVGITGRGIARNREHNTSKDWWPFVDRQTVEHFDARADAADRERNLIQEFRPPFNKQHNPGWADTRDAYIAYRGAMSSTVTARDLFNSLDKRMPLMLHEAHESRVTMRTLAAHAPLAHAIAFERDVRVHGGHRVGRICAIENKGMFALLHLKVKVERAITGGSASVKFLSQKPETFGIRSLHLDTEAVS